MKPPKKTKRSRCMGRSRGRLTRKIHTLVDAAGRPIGLELTEGQAQNGQFRGDLLSCARLINHTR